MGDTTVGRTDIQKFVGALYARKAKEGQVHHYLQLSKDAREYADALESKVILIDGPQLSKLMFDYGVGVATVNSYVVKRIDSDFFEDEVVAWDAAKTARAT